MRERIARAMRRVPDDSPASAYELRTADAVLDAMLEPTEAMLDAGARSHMEGVNYHGPIWQAMIDAAKEGA